MPAIAPRRPASAVPAITGLVISPPVAKASLVDISASGLLAEAGVPLRIDLAVKITFEGTFEPRSVEARVVRSSVAAMTPAGVRYHIGLAFKAAIQLDPTPSDSSDQPVASPEARDNPAAVSPPIAAAAAPVAAPPPRVASRVNRW